MIRQRRPKVGQDRSGTAFQASLVIRRQENVVASEMQAAKSQSDTERTRRRETKDTAKVSYYVMRRDSSVMGSF